MGEQLNCPRFIGFLTSSPILFSDHISHQKETTGEELDRPVRLRRPDIEEEEEDEEEVLGLDVEDDEDFNRWGQKVRRHVDRRCKFRTWTHERTHHTRTRC